MEFLTQYNVYVQGLIIASTIIGFTLIINFSLAATKPQKLIKNIKYIYAFGSGFLLITAIIDQLALGIHEGTEHFIDKIRESTPNAPEHIDLPVQDSMVVVAIILSGLVAGVITAILVNKWTQHYISKRQQFKCHNHDQNISNEYEAIVHSKGKRLSTAFMVVSHRLPAGLSIGILISSLNGENHGMELAALITFILHIIPEIFVLFLSFFQATNSNKKALIYTLIIKFSFLPLIMLGILIGEHIDMDSLFWIKPLIYSFTGMLMLWAVIGNLIPEIIHTKDSAKSMTFIIIIFMVGVIASTLIQVVHVH